MYCKHNMQSFKLLLTQYTTVYDSSPNILVKLHVHASNIHVILRDPGTARGDDVMLLDEQFIFGQKFTSKADKPLATYSYQTSSRSLRKIFFQPISRTEFRFSENKSVARAVYS